MEDLVSTGPTPSSFLPIILFMTQDSELDIPKQYIYTKLKKNMPEKKKNEKNQIKSMLHIPSKIIFLS